MSSPETSAQHLPSESRVYRLIRLYSVVGTGIFVLFAFLMFARGQVAIATGCAAGAVLMLGNLLFARTLARAQVSSLLLILIGGGGIIWVIINDLSRTSPYFWVPFFAMVPFFLLGQRRGLVASLVFAVPVVVLAFFTRADPVIAEHDPVFLLRFCMSLVGTLIFAFLFERSRSQAQHALQQANAELSESLSKVKMLSGFLPICARCKKIRDDQGYWNQIEAYIAKHSEAQFSHGLCEPCARELYGENLESE